MEFEKLRENCRLTTITMRSSQSLGSSVIDGQMVFLNVLHQPLNFMLFMSAFYKKGFTQCNRLTRNKENSLKKYIIAGFCTLFILARRQLINDVTNCHSLQDRRDSLLALKTDSFFRINQAVFTRDGSFSLVVTRLKKCLYA